MNPDVQNPTPTPQPVTNVPPTGVSTQQPIPTSSIQSSLNQEAPKPKSKILPLLIILLILIGLGTLGFWTYRNYFVSIFKPQPTTKIVIPTPSQSPITDNLNTLEWKNEKWEFPENSQEFFIPSVTYKISVPTSWIYKNVISDNVKRCYDISISDPKNVVALDINSICTSWGGDDDKTVLLSTYDLVKRVKMIRDGATYYQLIVRVEKTEGNIAYIGGETQSNDESIEKAYFTNAVLIKGNSAEENTHSYFNAVNITAKYTGNVDSKNDYLNIIDKIVSSVVMENIGYKN